MSMISRGNTAVTFNADEWWTSKGRKYSIHEVIEIPANSTRYLGVIAAPANSGRITAFNARFFKLLSGQVNIAIAQAVTGVSGTPAGVIYGNRANIVAPVTSMVLMGANAPATTPEGWIEYDEDDATGTFFSPGSAKQFPAGGYRVYQGEQAAVRFVNDDDAAARVIAGYTWLEPDA